MTKVKFLVLLFVVAILILVFPNIVSAATVDATETTTTSTGKTVTWSYELDSNNNIINLKCTNISSVSGELTIPSTIDGHTVLSLGKKDNDFSGKGAFEDCSGLTGIIIPNTVTTIGNYAFSSCTGLKTLTLPDSVTSIGGSAFDSCSGIKSVTLSKNLTSIGSYAFSRCTGLGEIVIPDSVTNIENGAFNRCTGLKKLTLSKNITKISKDTFENCSGLTSVIIPESVTTIEGESYPYGAFRGCTNLEKILIPDSVATIGENVFENCKKLTIYGNDGQVSKSYAEQKSIPFKYISQWDDSNAGSDITPPSVNSIEVASSSVLDCYDSNSTKYVVPSGKTLIINVNFSENILATKVPTLTIKFGNGSNIELTKGTVSGSKIEYTYTITSNDVGTMSVVSLAGGDVKDEAGNDAKLSCPELTVQYSYHGIYANGTVVDDKDNNNDNNNNNNNDNNNDNNNNNGSNNNPDTNEEDDTIATGILPKTGVGIGLTLIIVLLISGSIFAYTKYRKLRDI